MRGQGEEYCNRMPADISEYIKALAQRLKAVAIILFGSRATDRAHIQSDYDLLVIVPDLPTDFWSRQDLLWKDKPFSVDAIAFTPSEVAEKIHRGLILDALLQGVVLYGEVDDLKSKAQEHVEHYDLVRTEAGYVRKPA